MVEIFPGIFLHDDEIKVDFIRSSGPGGQNVNKVATAAQLRFDVRNSRSLLPEVKERLQKIASNRINEDGILVIDARRHRTQEQNRLDALNRLGVLIHKASQSPKTRKPTRPSLTARAARLSEKKKRGALKRIRHYDPDEWE